MHHSGDQCEHAQELARLRDHMAERERATAAWEREREALLARLAQTEHALRASQARFAGIVGLSEDAIISIDENQRIRLFNQGAEKIFGYRAEEILGRELDVLIPPRFTLPHRGHVRNFGASPDVLRPMNDRGTIFGLRRDGAEFPAEATILKFEVEGEKVFTVRLRDITERKQAEEELRYLEQRLTVLVEASGTLLSSLELADVLPAILDLARRLVEADAYAVWRFDKPAGEWRVVSAVGLSEGYRRTAARSGAEGGSVLSAAFSIEDVEQAPELASERDVYRAEGIRSLLAVPLRIHGQTSGKITFYCRGAHKFRETEIKVAGALANLAGSAIGTAELYEEQRRMRLEAEGAERRSAFLAEASSMLASSLDYEITLASVARLAVPHVADWCTVDVIEDDGAVRQLATAHVDPAKVARAKEIRRRFPPDNNAPRGVPHVLRTGQAELVSEITDAMPAEAARSPEHLALLRGIGITSYMCVPMLARGRTLGAITFVTAESGRRYGPGDLALVTDLARRAALAVDNARLYAVAQRERAAAESALEALRGSEARFRRLVDSGIIGIVLAEGDRITEANDIFLELVGYGREELHSGKLLGPEITAPEYHELDARALEELRTRGVCAPFEKEFLRKDGRRVPVLMGAALLEAHPQLSWVAFVVDLSERKELEARLRESQKLESIGLLAGGVAHDFNNLLTGIMGNASLAQELLPPASPVRPILDNVVRASERAADLTRQLLAYSGKGRFVVKPIHLSKLVREISSLLQTSVPKKVQFILNLDENLPPIDADSSQIQQLVMNLVINAAEAIGDNPGTVILATGAQELDETYIRKMLLREGVAPGKYVYLEVHDTGCGMDEETKDRIFDPFFTTKFTGRGLGLAAVLGIVRGHRGDIRVYSEPGKGSTFKVLLPASASHFQERAPTPRQHRLEGMGTILVVDDEEVVRQAAKAALERYRYEVVLAENGLHAVEILQRMSQEIALVLLDMTMPVMSGEEALERFREIRPDIRVIVSSGYNEVEAIRHFTGKGIAAFIQKPYTSAQLAEKVKSVLEGGQLTMASQLP